MRFSFFEMHRVNVIAVVLLLSCALHGSAQDLLSAEADSQSAVAQMSQLERTYFSEVAETFLDKSSNLSLETKQFVLLEKVKADLERGDHQSAKYGMKVLINIDPTLPGIVSLMRHFSNTNESQESLYPHFLISLAKKQLREKRFDEAARTAEEIFSYDALNPEASRLLDQIKKDFLKEALRERKSKKSGVQTEMYLTLTWEEADRLIAQGQLAEAEGILNRMLFFYGKSKEVNKKYRQRFEKISELRASEKGLLTNSN